MSASRLTQWGVTIAAWAAAGAWAGDVAQVPETLKADAAYTTYSKAIVQLDLLANPATAGLPIVIESALPGVLDVRGSVPTSRLKNHVLQSTLRISGLRVRETLRVAPTPRAKEGLLDGKERLALERSTKETIEALFPELKEKIQTSVGRDGIVVCNGECPNYETRLLLAQAMKSQPGCAAVVTLMTIPALPGSQRIPVSADGRETLFAAQLPRIPDAPAIDLAVEDERVQTPGGGRAMADDAPAGDVDDQRLLELIRAKLDRDAELKVLKLEIEVSAGTVSLGGNTQSKKQVELAVALANEVPGVTKVVAKTRPASIQRHRPKTFDAAAEEAGLPPEAAHKPKRKLFGIIPLGGDSKTPQPVAVTSRNYRETLKKTLQKRCGDQLKDLSIKASADGKGLLIEGKVANPSVRRACFKQIDNLVELRSVSYDFVLQITDPE